MTPHRTGFAERNPAKPYIPIVFRTGYFLKGRRFFMLVSLLRVLLLYPVVIFGIRLMGKRQIGELQPAELVITMLISNIATLPIEDRELPLLAGIVPMLTLICCEVLLSWVQLHSRRFRRLLSGSPQVIIRGGKIDRQVMETLRLSLDDLMTALRTNGIFDVSEAEFAAVETNGTVSVCPKAANRPLTPADVGLRPQEEAPPEVLIADGSLLDAGMQAAGFSDQKLRALLKEKHLQVGDVFLLTASGGKIRTLITKEECSQ